MLDLIIKNGECYIDAKITKTNIGTQNGKITTIGDLSNEKSKETVDASNLPVSYTHLTLPTTRLV